MLEGALTILGYLELTKLMISMHNKPKSDMRRSGSLTMEWKTPVSPHISRIMAENSR